LSAGWEPLDVVILVLLVGVLVSLVRLIEGVLGAWPR
jgi:hypothetical protein